MIQALAKAFVFVILYNYHRILQYILNNYTNLLKGVAFTLKDYYNGIR